MKYGTVVLSILLIILLFSAVGAALVLFRNAYIETTAEHPVHIMLVSEECGRFHVQVDQLRGDEYIRGGNQHDWSSCNDHAYAEKFMAQKGDSITGVFESAGSEIKDEFYCTISIDGKTVDSDRQTGFPNIAMCTASVP